MKQLTENPSQTSSAPQRLNSGTASVDKLSQPEDNHEPPEVRAAKDLALRYRLPFVELLPTDQDSPIDYEIFQEIPVDLMVRHQFLPLKRDEKGMHLAMADPSYLERLDELSSALRSRIVPYVATAGAIEVILRRGDATQRVLQ